jgi:predicted nicotinamide N-methyase
MTMKKPLKKEIRAHGVRLLLSRHPEIRKLKRLHYPTFHGNKHWSSSWLLMDYLGHNGLPKKAHIMEVGCGWGLAGIYCAKKHGAIVTGVDKDPDVFPYLKLHAHINREKITTLKADLRKIKKRDLNDMDVIIGADICFWDSMVNPLRKLIQKALKNGVKQVFVADPGRPTFEKIVDYFCKRGIGKVYDWDTRRPRSIEGRILRVDSNSG